VSFLGELILEIVGEGVASVFSSKKKPRAPFKEGESKASLGAVSLFFAVLALVFSGLLFLAPINQSAYEDMGGVWIFGILAVALFVGVLARRAGSRAPSVTRRNLGMAKGGVWVANLAIALSLVGIALCGLRLLRGVL
jgi:hypothetical protein